MKVRIVAYSDDARDDLDNLLMWLAEQSSPAGALSVVADLEDFIASLAVASERGTSLEHFAPGVRIIPHKRAMIVVEVADDTVLVARVFYGGQDWEAALRRRFGMGS
jgi:plasmid stabilization system protein ParE